MQFERKDGVLEIPHAENNISLVADGPLYARGDIEIRNTEGELLYRETRAALCRCGASGNKPFWDNSHHEVGFHHDGSLGKNGLLREEASEDHSLAMHLIPNGQLLLRGEVEIRDAAGEVLYKGSKAVLCCCASSASKPFCDGSHVRPGWRADLRGLKREGTDQRHECCLFEG